MRLTELYGIKSHRAKNIGMNAKTNNLQDYMESIGFEFLSQGTKSRLFTYKTNPNLVVKVFLAQDTAFEYFVEYCNTHKSPYLPKFRGNTVKINNRFRMIRIERLEDLTYEDWSKFDYFAININVNTSRMKQSLEKCIEENPELKDFLYTLVEVANNVANNPNICLDIHQWNFMKRGNTFVITDPYYIYGSTSD